MFPIKKISTGHGFEPQLCQTKIEHPLSQSIVIISLFFLYLLTNLVVYSVDKIGWLKFPSSIFYRKYGVCKTEIMFYDHIMQ